ncbi:hypothetical protein CsSME_00020206 [Camellia sinensis var. sinensis]
MGIHRFNLLLSNLDIRNPSYPTNEEDPWHFFANLKISIDVNRPTTPPIAERKRKRKRKRK